MANMVVIGTCWGCGKMFSFNPNRVPSIRVEGERQPVCLDCITATNEKRKEMGVDLFPIPTDAYEPEKVV